MNANARELIEERKALGPTVEVNEKEDLPGLQRHYLLIFIRAFSRPFAVHPAQHARRFRTIFGMVEPRGFEPLTS